ncbi:MAG: hypothetical protein EBY44_01135 [Actinobacteria bacterium]|nr:hypothetical protein [Actinomycetota bacterium]
MPCRESRGRRRPEGPIRSPAPTARRTRRSSPRPSPGVRGGSGATRRTLRVRSSRGRRGSPRHRGRRGCRN